MSVDTWDKEKVQYCIRLATGIEFYLFDFENDTIYKEYLFNELVEKIKKTKEACADLEKYIPSIDEICNCQRLLYRTLLNNPYLSLDMLAYVIETYDLLFDSDKKKSIIKDVIMGSKSSMIADVLTGVQMTLLEGLSRLKSATCAKGDIMSSLKEEYSFKLLPKTISYRAAAKLLIRDCSRYINEGGLLQYNKYLIIKKFSDYINKSPQNLEILFHAYIITLEIREKYLDKNEEAPLVPADMYGPLLDYILSVIDEKSRLPYLEVDSVVLEPKIWGLHPWMLAKISYHDETFFLKYRKKLMECTRQEQRIMVDDSLSSMIESKMFYRQIHVHENDSQIDYEMMEMLLKQWNIFINVFEKRRADKLIDFLKEEWIIFKETFTNYEYNRASNRTFKKMFIQTWMNFFKELGVHIESYFP
ncbi:18704_t:CDS:2 [Funneliformis geosporum]|uniref:13880_t:CDS:1 n=1 Tax=Funneliformis geosporum TaxID=1117311 RepID=A0A9W4WUH1_9GLOM|nr:13880_t:CDS:2 [Funneliformis geosporum]CAI2182009.1 18704_t:CDS:2 [Funneliformis geosporum]